MIGTEDAGLEEEEDEVEKPLEVAGEAVVVGVPLVDGAEVGDAAEAVGGGEADVVDIYYCSESKKSKKRAF